MSSSGAMISMLPRYCSRSPLPRFRLARFFPSFGTSVTRHFSRPPSSLRWSPCYGSPAPGTSTRQTSMAPPSISRDLLGSRVLVAQT